MGDDITKSVNRCVILITLTTEREVRYRMTAAMPYWKKTVRNGTKDAKKTPPNIRQPSEIIGTSSAMFGTCSEVVGNFSEIRLIWIRKSHAFDFGKVGRYNIVSAVNRITTNELDIIAKKTNIGKKPITHTAARNSES